MAAVKDGDLFSQMYVYILGSSVLQNTVKR